MDVGYGPRIAFPETYGCTVEMSAAWCSPSPRRSGSDTNESLSQDYSSILVDWQQRSRLPAHLVKPRNVANLRAFSEATETWGIECETLLPKRGLQVWVVENETAEGIGVCLLASQKLTNRRFRGAAFSIAIPLLRLSEVRTRPF